MKVQMRSSGLAVTFCVALFASVATARADVVLDWNAIAVRTLITQPAPGVNPFAQARFMAITQLAVFEAVNAVEGGYEPYLGTIAPAPGASAEAAAIAAAYRVLVTYFSSPANTAALNAERASSLALIPDGPVKDAGIAVGEAAAQAMIAARANDGSAAVPNYVPPTGLPAGAWQLTPGCAGGVLYQWSGVTPFGIPNTADFIPAPPPALSSNRYLKDFLEVQRVGAADSTERPQDRTDVARFYASVSPSWVANVAARQMSTARADSLSENARALALINMAISDGLVVSFATKYHYNLWRPVTAIRLADDDGNEKTTGDPLFTPLISTPCFPSYPSNHASGTNSGLEVLRRVYGAAGHDLTLAHPTLPLTLEYNALTQISADVDDARVYGGIHFRFDQVEGGRLGREVATYVYKHNLRKVSGPN
jgi:hypothetical protein